MDQILIKNKVINEFGSKLMKSKNRYESNC